MFPIIQKYGNVLVKNMNQEAEKGKPINMKVWVVGYAFSGASLTHMEISPCLPGSLLQETLLQMDSRTWDKSVESLSQRNCDHLLLFNKVAPDSSNSFYLCSFNSSHEQFYNQFLLPKFLNIIKIITGLFLASFPFCLLTLL